MKVKLEQLRELMGDGYIELLDAYLEDAPVRINAMKEAIEDDDLETISREAHTFKGSSSNMGALELVSLCDDLERCSGGGLREQLAEKISQLHERFCVVEDLLRAEIKSC